MTCNKGLTADHLPNFWFRNMPQRKDSSWKVFLELDFSNILGVKRQAEWNEKKIDINNLLQTVFLVNDEAG